MNNRQTCIKEISPLLSRFQYSIGTQVAHNTGTDWWREYLIEVRDLVGYLRSGDSLLEEVDAAAHEEVPEHLHLLHQPDVQLQVVPPAREAGQLYGERERVSGVEEVDQGLHVLRDLQDARQSALVVGLRGPRVPVRDGTHHQRLGCATVNYQYYSSQVY